VPSDEIVLKVDALTADDVRAAGRRLLHGAPTLAAIGPIKGLPSLARIGAALSG
jgi:predicted Zn-dependent peptidase